MFLLILCVILCVRARARCFVKVQVFVVFGFEIWECVVLCVMINILWQPATSYTIEYSKRQNSVTHCSWHTIQDAATTQWPYGILMLCGQAVYCALLPVLLFFFVVGVVRLRRSLVSQETYKFIANHPFVFVIHERRTDLMLFIGRCMKPTAVVMHHTELWLCICF
jgi:hypothetical protein